MWTVIYVASDEDEANNLRDKLIGEGFLVKTRSLGKENDNLYELLVLETEVDEALEVLNQGY